MLDATETDAVHHRVGVLLGLELLGITQPGEDLAAHRVRQSLEDQRRVEIDHA